MKGSLAADWEAYHSDDRECSDAVKMTNHGDANMNLFAKLSTAFALVLFVSGCATSRSVVAVDQGLGIANPQQGEAIRITKVSDERKFTPSPPQADMPSLSESDIGNPAITSRAIGRKRGGFGKALGDVLLPPGQTVSSLMREATTTGFRKAGFRVLSENDAGYYQAIPIEVTVREFWSWFSPGFASVKVTNRCELSLQSPLPAIGNGAIVHGAAVVSGGAIFESDWQKVVAMGVRNLADNTAAALVGQPQTTPVQ
jgi:hypothetical protein